jgi:uncharacterized protein
MEMFRFLAPAALCLTLIGGLATTAHAEDAITVSGVGQVAVEPNMAFVEAAVVTQGKTVREAQAMNAQSFNAAVDAIKTKFRLEDKHLQSAGYSVAPVYEDRPNGQRILKGYSVRHSLKVIVMKLDDLGSIVDQLGASGINQLDLIRFSHNDKRKYELDALSLAMDDARVKAEVIARSSGRALQKVSKVSYNTSEAPEAVVRGEALEKAADVTEFIPGELTIRAYVTVEYLF